MSSTRLRHEPRAGCPSRRAPSVHGLVSRASKAPHHADFTEAGNCHSQLGAGAQIPSEKRAPHLMGGYGMGSRPKPCFGRIPPNIERCRPVVARDALIRHAHPVPPLSPGRRMRPSSIVASIRRPGEGHGDEARLRRRRCAAWSHSLAGGPAGQGGGFPLHRLRPRACQRRTRRGSAAFRPRDGAIRQDRRSPAARPKWRRTPPCSRPKRRSSRGRAYRQNASSHPTRDHARYGQRAGGRHR